MSCVQTAQVLLMLGPQHVLRLLPVPPAAQEMEEKVLCLPVTPLCCQYPCPRWDGNCSRGLWEPCTPLCLPG